MADRVLMAQAHKEITEYGLKSRSERLKEAQVNLDFYKGDFGRAPARDRGSTAYDASRYPRYSLIMQRAADVLSMNLYSEGPTRKLQPEDDTSDEGPYERVTKWLNSCYRKNRMDAKFQRADLLSCVSEVAMFHVIASDDPDWPIRINLWDSSQFDVWCDRDDMTNPSLVAIMDVWDNRNRIRLYSDELTRVYLSDPIEVFGDTDPGYSQRYKFVEDVPNPYGVLPFSFVHFHLPITEFWTGSPGTNLRKANDCINFKITETFDCIRFNLRPIVKLSNVRPDYRVPSPIKPGDVWNMAGSSDSTSESNKQPDASYLQADSSFVEADWQDTQSFIDHTLEMNGVPPSVIRMTQDSVRSGVAIVAEQLPLIAWAKKRQLPFGYYEEDLVRVVLKIGARHLGSQADKQYKATAKDLEMVAANPGLVLKWPKMYPRIPGQDQDQSDKFLLDEHLISKTMLLMERDNLTREEAEMRLEEIAEDLEREQDLFSGLEMAVGMEPQAGVNGKVKLAQANEGSEDEREMEEENDSSG